MKRIIEFTNDEKKIHHIFLTANFLKNSGIDNGKMGVVIYLLHKCHETPNATYEDFAFELLEEIDRIANMLTDVKFRSGLCGIGWGFEYLIKNRFLETETDLCASFENKIWRTFQWELSDGTIKINNIIGYLLYFLARIESFMVKVNTKEMQKNKSYIIDAIDKLEELLKENVVITEKDNSMFHNEVPLILSHWEYPVILWILGRVVAHQLYTSKVEQLLTELIEKLLLPDSLPNQKRNRTLLYKVLCDINKLELHNIDLNQKIRMSILPSLHITGDKDSFRMENLMKI